jgi:hypothetical protein
MKKKYLIYYNIIMLYYNIVCIIILIIILICYNNNFIKNIENYDNEKRYKVACITSIYGNYDELKTPNIKNMKLVDWYCFTDSNIKNDIWQIINKEYHIENMKDEYKINKNYYNNIIDKKIYNMMSAKYYKIKTHEIDILKEYDYYIWIDGSIYLQDEFLNNILFIIYNNDINLINFKHSEREFIRDETLFSLQMPKYNDQDLDLQYNKYLKNGYLDNYGLYENTIIIKRNDKKINTLFNKWWEHNIKYSYQDQISYPYVLFKCNIKPDYVINENVFNNSNYSYVDFELMKTHV